MRVNKAGYIIENGMERLWKKLDLTQNIALCVVLLVWHTTLVGFLQLEVGISHIQHILDHLYLLASLRLYWLEPNYLLHI